MKKYDHIVVGSGAAGMTFTLLLALSGRSVLLIEKAPRPGGSLARFRIDGIPFDTGFHFTGGLKKNGILWRMLKVLGIADSLEPVFLASEKQHRFMFEDAQRTIELPCGIRNLRKKLKSYFPGEGLAVDGYFDLIEKVYKNTATTDITRLGERTGQLDEERVSLKEVMDGLTGNAMLKGVFSAFSMCHGVRPSEVSFANHSRVCYDLYEGTACFRDGGDALVDAFVKKIRALGAEIRCGTSITEFRESGEGSVESAILDSGEEVAFESAILTIHPKQIIKLIPGRRVSKALAERVESFEPSVGFFTVYGTLESNCSAAPASSIVSLYPTSDFEGMLDPEYRGEQALVLVEHPEVVSGNPRRTVTILEPSFPQEMSRWSGTRSRERPADYTAWKKERVAKILEHIERADSSYRTGLKVMGAASVLTYRDYLHSHDGSAYGIKQKLGQFNLIGRLPGRTLFAAGQSALLPGLAGAMMSSFIVSRSILGKEDLGRFIGDQLCKS